MFNFNNISFLPPFSISNNKSPLHIEIKLDKFLVLYMLNQHLQIRKIKALLDLIPYLNGAYKINFVKFGC